MVRVSSRGRSPLDGNALAAKRVYCSLEFIYQSPLNRSEVDTSYAVPKNSYFLILPLTYIARNCCDRPLMNTQHEWTVCVISSTKCFIDKTATRSSDCFLFKAKRAGSWCPQKDMSPHHNDDFGILDAPWQQTSNASRNSVERLGRTQQLLSNTGDFHEQHSASEADRSTILFSNCSESACFTYHSQRTPSGPLTHVSVFSA